MSTSIERTIWCDTENCGSWETRAVSDGASTARELRNTARSWGWMRRKVGLIYMDLCPTCSSKESDVEVKA